MSKLNRDILYLIFEELHHDGNTLYSCLSVNKIWCEAIIPILWKDLWKHLKKRNEGLLLNVILSHLSDETKESLEIQSQQKPLFNYISFCRHLDLHMLELMIYNNLNDKVSTKFIVIFKNEIFGLFINENTNFTHLYITHQVDFQILLIPGVKRCFSNLEFLHCNTSINSNMLYGLSELCKSIKELELYVEYDGNNYEIVKLIETSKKLYNVRFLTRFNGGDVLFRKTLENSLIRSRHTNTIQYFRIEQKPVTKVLSSFVNLKRLELEDNDYQVAWDCLKDLSLPFLQVLSARSVSIRDLTSLIENTKGNLTEVKIDFAYRDEVNNKSIIQAIYKHCPNLKYLKLLFRHNNISELEKLLVSCKYLSGLFILTDEEFDWDNLFKILAKSSPTCLFKFKLYFYESPPSLAPLKLFFDNWKGRHPMLLQIININLLDVNDLIEKYKAEGIVKKYDEDHDNIYYRSFEDFEWNKKKFSFHSKFFR